MTMRVAAVDCGTNSFRLLIAEPGPRGELVELTDRLAAEPDLAAHYATAHRAYLAARDDLAAASVGPVDEIATVSAGGMPTRVKCLHALLGHALAAGPGVNPIGDLTVELIAARWPFPCPVE